MSRYLFDYINVKIKICRYVFLFIQTSFHLYTRRSHPEKIARIHNETSKYIPEADTNFDSTKRTVFITHGWHGHARQDWIVRAKNNIIALVSDHYRPIHFKILYCLSVNSIPTSVHVSV